MSIPAAGWGQTAACDLPPQNEVLGTVAGRTITRLEAEAVWRTKDPATFFAFERQRYEMTMHGVQELMAETLLQREAARRGITVDGLLEAEVSARAAPITDEAIRAEFERIKTTLPFASLEQARSMVHGSLKQRQASDARVAFVTELLDRDGKLIDIYHKAPRQIVPIDDQDPVLGPADAPVTLVVFSDFQCPYCQKAEAVLAALQEKFRGRIRLVWKDFPLPIHGQARAAATAARCAGEQGAFWEYRDELFRNQSELSDQQFVGFAQALQLDDRAFLQCVASDRFDAIIDATVEEGRQLGVNATPTMFVNGAAVTGAVPLARLESLIREELRAGAP